MPGPEANRVCDECGRWVDEREILFHARLEVHAEARLPDLDKLAAEGPVGAQFAALVDRLAKMSEEEAQDATDLVHEEVRFVLCPQCRRALHLRMAQRRFLAKE
jgi:hypothetical protein